MASGYKIVTYGNSALRKKASPVKKVDAAIRKLAQEMLETMYLGKGVGLAAQQIGRTEAICVIDIPKARDIEDLSSGTVMPVVMVNPRIDEMSGEQRGDEGCLSFPEIFVAIKRANEVTVTFVNLQNKEETIKTAGFLARAVQHELDHLNGILLVDRMSVVQKLGVAGKLKRLKKQAAE